MLVRLSVPPTTDEEKALLDAHKVNSLPDPTYGGQLQDFSIQGIEAEGKLKIDYKERKVKLAGGETVNLRVPTYSLTDLNYGPASPDIMISPRVAPQMIGLGLLEAVPEEQILASADPDDANKDGISGKPNEVWSREHQKLMLGRFGWKAGIPTIAQQAAEAFNGDIGLSTTMIPKGARRLHREGEGLSRCAERCTRRTIRTSRWATTCSPWSRSIPRTSPFRRGASPTIPRC